MNSTHDYILSLIAAKMCGENLSEEEERYLEQWKAICPENQKFYNDYQTLFDRKEQLKLYEKVCQPEKVVSEIVRRRRISDKRFTVFMKYAAIVIPVLAISSWIFLHKEIKKPVQELAVMALQDVAPGKQKARLKFENGETISLSDSSMIIHSHENIQVGNGGVLQYAINQKKSELKVVYHTLVVDRGAEFQLVLPDGSKVWLNSDSELKYPNVFNGDTRKVYLKGEAYFEVKHLNNQPFIVTAKECDIRVLGTEFNVSSYEEENEVVTTLIQGKVAYHAGKNKGELFPGEQCIYSAREKTSVVKKVDVNQYISWKNGLFIFDQIRMEDLATQIARWYDVAGVFPDNKARSIRFTGAMERYKPVSYIIQMLNETNTVECSLEGNMLVFRQK